MQKDLDTVGKVLERYGLSFFHFLQKQLLDQGKTYDIKYIKSYFSKLKKLDQLQYVSAFLLLQNQQDSSYIFSKNIDDHLAFQNLMYHSVDSIYFKDTESRFLVANASFLEDFGLASLDELIGKNNFDFFEKTYAQKTYEDEQFIVQTGEGIAGMEEKEVWKNGEETWMLTTKMPLYDHDGSVVGVFGISKDITKRKFAEEELKQSNKKLKKFFSVMDSGIKNPFSSLMGFSELLIKSFDTMTKKEVEKIHEYIYFSSKRVYNMLDNLFEWTSLTLGTLEINSKYGYISELLNQNLKYYEIIAQKKHVKIHCDSGPDVLIYADPKMISIVLRNLISNAIKYSHEGGDVFVSISLVGKFVQVQIKDFGIGISVRDQKNLFDLHVSSNKNFDGSMGLGLKVSKEFVEKNGGKISFESKKGKGSTFTFTVPIQEG